MMTAKVSLETALMSWIAFNIYIYTGSSYNPLPRAAGKIQYEAEAKPRPSNCILPEARGSGL